MYRGRVNGHGTCSLDSDYVQPKVLKEKRRLMVFFFLANISRCPSFHLSSFAHHQQQEEGELECRP
jgi:hypothetical protein